MYVRLSKVAATDGAKYPTAERNSYVDGAYNGYVSPPVEYTVEGELVSPPTLGQRLKILRHVRNDVEALGFMQTSPVTEVAEGEECIVVSTENSVYLLEYLGGSNA